MLAAVLGVIAAALVVVLGAVAPDPGIRQRAERRLNSPRLLLAGPGAVVFVLLLLAVLLGSGAARAGGMVILLVAALVILIGLAAAWSWLRLQIAG